jgi:hypothetical protein
MQKMCLESIFPALRTTVDAVRGRKGGNSAIELTFKFLILLEWLGFWTLSIVRNSKYLENRTFRKINLFPSQQTFKRNTFTPISESSQTRNQCKRLSFLRGHPRTRLILNALLSLVFQNLFRSRTPVVISLQLCTLQSYWCIMYIKNKLNKSYPK